MGGLCSLALQQKNISSLYSFFLLSSQVRIATKNVKTKIKSSMTPIAAYIQNDCKAGILVNAPTMNAKVSQKAAVVILGPTA